MKSIETPAPNSERRQKGGEKMRSYDIRIKIPEGRIKEIMDKIDKAQETIYKCYDELVLLGAVTIEKTSPNKDDASKD